ncbi:hypothetical protein GBK02_02330 [Dechloromonas sp. TW-R-39-2]|uniref:hypothetical protein n=1 Tax=Dechloromonas sp. TW-R-39-2 TaxID=2654218 RepID=UPI00193E2BC4|nr:hypothetical protein [Dechloromonas sp. TW-R-39-2]QRM18316.1 hypothetical protein GBK02_02330 [Dechloromonas sp. TW-R-39-2]
MSKLLIGPLLLLLAGSVQAAGESYCCQDPATGRRICADTLPDQCRGRGYKIFDAGGNVLKEVGPPLTAEQKAEQIAEKRQQAKLEEANREQRRKDQALLDTYATPQDIDISQRNAEADINQAIAAAQAQIDIARKKRKKAEAEAEFYKKKALPPELDKELRTLDNEIKVQQELLNVKKQDFTTVRNKYDADRKRYQELTGKTSSTAPNNGAAPRRP